MNPTAPVQPTNMNVAVLLNTVSCDVEPLVRLLIDMKSRHAGLFEELMCTLEVALLRNSTKLVDVITRIFGGSKDINGLFDESMFKAPMSFDMTQCVVERVMQSVDTRYQTNLEIAMGDEEDVPSEVQKEQSLTIRRMTDLDPVYVQIDSSDAFIDWRMPAVEFVKIWNIKTAQKGERKARMMAQKKERKMRRMAQKKEHDMRIGQMEWHLLRDDHPLTGNAGQKLKRAKTTKAREAALRKADEKNYVQQFIADVVATDPGQLARVARQKEEEDEYRAQLALLTAVPWLLRDDHPPTGNALKPATKTEAGPVTTKMHDDQIVDALI